MEGTPFGNYRLLQLLSRDSFGDVWRAYDADAERTVAVKVLPAHLADDAPFKERFRREAHAAAMLSEPHVVPVHRVGEINGRLFVEMRLIEGRSLAAVLREGPLDATRTVTVIEQLAAALQAAHAGGLVHRRVKPSTILLSGDDFVSLVGFGTAGAADDRDSGAYTYASPESLHGQSDSRSDIYQLTCVLYECLTGHPPYSGETAEQLMVAHLTETPPRPSVHRTGVPVAMDDVVAEGMAKDPARRFATASELAVAARAALASAPAVAHLTVFVSYSSHDSQQVDGLTADLVRAGIRVWMDDELRGGQEWWTTILQQIRDCTVFVVAVSKTSLSSKPCRAEWDYALALGLPVLPVQIDEVSSYRNDPIFTRQIVDYRYPGSAATTSLVAALHEQAADRRELPDPLPTPPPIPYEYLIRLGTAIRDVEDMPHSAQMQALMELSEALEIEEDMTVVDDIRGLLQTLRNRHDVSHAAVREIDGILSRTRS